MKSIKENRTKMDVDTIENAVFKTTQTIQWGDMDAAQHVNNTVYLKWVETARIGFYEQLEVFDLGSQELGIILAHQDCKYIYPLTYPDEVILTYDIISLKKDRIIGECRIYSPSRNQLAAISQSTVMAYNYKEFEKKDIPADWKAKLVEIYGDRILVD